MQGELLRKTSADVVRYIVKKDPRIEGISVLGYSEFSYAKPAVGAPIWIPRSKVLTTKWENSRQFPKKAHNGSHQEIEDDFTFLCLDSRVKLDGLVWHIPMLDFDGDFMEDMSNRVDAMEEIHRLLEYAELPSGVLLNSGGGLHYIGLELIRDFEFRRVIHYLNRLPTDDIYYLDDEWLNYTIDRDYFILRLVGADYKPVTPKVVSLFTAGDRSRRRPAQSITQLTLGLLDEVTIAKTHLEKQLPLL